MNSNSDSKIFNDELTMLFYHSSNFYIKVTNQHLVAYAIAYKL